MRPPPAIPISWVLAAVMIVVALYHAHRLIRTRDRPSGSAADTDLTHLTMCAVMAIMLIGSLDATASHRWGIAFAMAAFWFGGRGIRSGLTHRRRAGRPHLEQAAGCCAMVVMLLPAAGWPRRRPGSPRECPAWARPAAARTVFPDSASYSSSQRWACWLP